MKRSHSLNWLFLALCLFTLALLAYPTVVTSAERNGIEAAWERAREAGAYRFTTDVEQTLIPRPLPSMIGQTDERVDMRIEGEVALPDYARLELYLEGAGLDVPPLGLIQDGTETFLLKDGEKVPVENPAGLSSPTADYLGYLAAAENVRECESASQRVGESAQLACYTYDINGPRFAEYVRAQMQAQLEKSEQPLPPNVELSPSPLLQRMSGHGELWVDADGLPRRQVIDLEMPEVSEEYDVQVHMVVDFVFDEEATQQIGKLASERIIGGIKASIAPTDFYCLLLSVVIASVLIAYRRRRWVYGLIAVSVSIIMVVSPLLQMAGIVRFQERQAQAAPAETIAEALGLSTDSTESPAHATRTTSSGPTPTHQCGDGTPGEDTDKDGLDDVTEYCLGTDPYYGDSDRDMITDTLEIEGFNFGGRTWPSDPFKPDSNDDGLADMSEWPAPVGEAPNFDDLDDWDPDGDGVPNLWDPDNDGDGVPDDLDLSPFSRTDYTDTFALTTQGGSFDGYQYIEVQLQPQNQDHLRYTTTPLDWPHDEKGQIQELDDSTEDLRLIPMLKILTNQPPDVELAIKYGVSTFENDDGTYDLYAPLMPVGDGAQIVAFYAKVAYGPDELADIRWENAQMIWMVQADIDEHGGPTLIQTYTEGAVRVTGLQIAKSRDFESAILGTPGSPEDDQQLFNVLFGLSATFLNNQTPDLQTVYDRFDNPNTDIVETWGVPAADVAIDFDTYGHTDEGLADMNTRTLQFLDQYPTDSTPSLIIALQEELGLYSMDYLAQLEPAASFNVNLETVDMGTQRSLKRASYQYESDGWEAMSLEDTLAMVQERYDDLSGTLADLHAQYPELTEHDLEGTLFLFYSVSYLGQTRVVAINGQVIAPEQRSDHKVYDQFNQPADTLLAYLIEVVELGEPGGGLRIGADQTQTWAYQRDNEEMSSDLGIGGVAGDFYDFGKDLLPDDKARYIANAVIKSVRTTLAILTAVQCIQWATGGRYFGMTGWTKFSRTFGWASRMKLSIRILGAIGLVVSLAVIWVQFGLTTDWSNPLAVKQAVTYAIVATVITVLLFVISLNPIGAILVGILVLVDLIVFFATGGELSIMATAIKAVAEFFYEVNELTYLDDADFVDFDTTLVDPEMGVIKGSRFQVSDEFVGKIKRTSDGDSDDLDDSYAYGKFNGSATGAVAVNKNSSRCSGVGTGVSGKTLTCRNDVKVEYQLNQDKRNVQLNVEALVYARVYYEECGLAGLVCSRKSQYIDLPDDLDKEDQWGPMTIYLDVLPDDPTGLWNWSEITNPDRDGDGLLNSEEVNTDPDNWDSDGDGLSDKFEFDSQENLGTDPNQYDTDGDGLSDGFEYRIGTRIDNPDSDGDGLTDGEEVYHQAAGGQWVGGWEVSLPGSVQTAWVFSNPLDADADADGLDDFTERANSTSPYAYNDAPRLTLDADPLAVNPNGTIGAYVEPGDTVVLTLTLESTGPHPIDSTLTLCLPDFLTDLQGGDLRGDRTPPRQPAPDCNGFQWSFGGEHTLQLWETVSTTITSTVESNLSASVSDEVIASLPYQVRDEPEDITTRVPVVVDVDNPEVAIVAPSDGALLGGGISSYVIGGSASDPSSWVTRVDVDLPIAGTVTAEGISPWAYTWELPADGVYDLTAIAYDYLGHASPPDTVQVTVDNTPPEVDLDLADGAYVTGQSSNVITVTLTGSANDNLSGLTRVQISTDDKPWREVWAEGGAPLTANWSTDWILPDEESAQGKHTVAVRAFDRAGNESETLQRTIIVDVAPPTDELTNRTYLSNPPHSPASQPHTFHGVANDVGNVPQPSRPAELVGTLDSISDATIWLGLSAIDENDAGVSVAWLGDFNGDRLADLAVGLPAAEDGDGQVTVIYGRAGGWPVPSDLELLAESRTSFVGKAGAGIGGSMAAAGDVDGDGFNDLLIGDAENDRVYLVFGRPNPLGRDLLLDGPQPAVWSVLTAPDGEQIGEWLAAAGDVNGDGYDDLLIGAAGTDDKVYLLLGQASPWWETVELDMHAAAQIEADPANATLSGVGDVDGDQWDEFVIATGNTVHLFAGDDGFTARANETLTLADATDTFASSDAQPQVAALGYVNDDDLSDFIYADGNAPRLVFGDADHNWSTHDFSGFSPAASGFLAAPGDVDTDGFADVLIGNADDDAYLFLADDLSTVEATLTGVQTAASAPYAAGADLNSDGSSDLLLVPTEAAASDKGLASPNFGEMPYINPEWLPVAPSSGETRFFPKNLVSMATLTVDDDGCTGCYTTIQAAVDAAGDGDTINVLPGVYGAFTINGKDNLTVSGVHPDAVFVDGGGGSHAAKIQNATGVTLERLTLRDAVNAVELDDAGVNGWQTPSLRITLDHLLIYEFTNHAVYMDRTSTASLTQSTLAGGDNHLAVTGDPDPAFEADWTDLTPSGTPATNDGGGIAAYGGDIYAARGGGSTQIDRYDTGTEGWSTYANTPMEMAASHSAMTLDENGSLWALRVDEFAEELNNSIYAMAYVDDDEIYVGGSFTNISPDGHVARWNGSEWQAMGSGLPREIYALAVSGGYVYAGGDTGLWRWNGSSWTALGTFFGGERDVYAIAVYGYNVYVGGDFDGIDGDYYYNNIARWDDDDGDWEEIGIWNCNGVDGPVNALAIYDDRLYVGGDFSAGYYYDWPPGCQTVASPNLIRLNLWNNTWDTTRLSAMNPGDEVNALAFNGASLYVGGDFSCVGVWNCDQDANNLARFKTGTLTWEIPAYMQADGSVHAITIDDAGDNLYIGGRFSAVGDGFGTPATRVARRNWDDDEWYAFPGTFKYTVYALAVDGDDAYIAGSFTHTHDGFVTRRFIHWDGDQWAGRYFYQHDGSSWNQRSLSGLSVPLGAGATLLSDGAGHLYMLPGGDSNHFYRYDTGSDVWQSRANFPDTPGAGGTLVWADGDIYAARGGNTTGFYRYNVSGNSWTALAPLPAYVFSAGASLAWDGRDWIYALTGGNGKQYLRYHIPTDQWEILGDGSSLTPDDKDTPYNVNAGGGLVYMDQALYGVPGGNVAQLWRYDPVAIYPEKLTLDQVAFAVPETAATPSWYNLDLTIQPDDFMLVGDDNAWVGGSGATWSPDPSTNPPLSGSSQITHDQAQFVDAARDVYRIRDGSVLNAGYHTYRATAYVAPSGEEFTSIQDAILSDANSVVVRPGQYPQSFYLISGVNVLGSRADQTILEPPPGHTDPLVTAEGVVGGRLSGFTLAGDGSQDGLRVEDGAQSVTISRSIIRGTDTGIQVTGGDTDLEVVNNTIVENTDGMVASSCAPVDVRNTIFAYHNGTGLSYEPCAPTKLHTYNNFWANGADLSPAEPGAGEIFLDPLFVDRFAHDYRTQDNSPAIDAGNPTDPSPPGTGGRVDIGYIEQGRAAYYADDDYCETCPNDGLTWQVDAFDVIQDALDAAADDLAALNTTDDSPQYTVGVGPGTYHEQVTVPSHVRLVGSGAEETTIDAGGSGSPVTFNGVVQAEISGFTLTGAGSPGVAVSGASNAITITRNIILDNPTGIAFSERASGLVTFNTLVDNGDGISSNGIGAWATVENNILSGNDTGLHTVDSGHIFNNYNLLDNTTNYNDEAGTGLAQGPNELVGVDPLFVDAGAGNYRLQPASPSVDAASPFAEVPAGGGERADLGYRELLAAPVALFLGKEDVSTATGNSGVSEVEVGITLVLDPSQPVTDTLPSTWNTVPLDSPGETASYWQTDFTPGQEGLHRFYSRATDVVGNQETDEEDWYDGAFVADDTPPVVTWLEPADGTTLSSPLELRAEASDYAAGEFSVEDIHFEVDGSSYFAEWAAEPWDEENEEPRVFRAWVSLADGTYNSVFAVAEDKAGHMGQSAPPIAFTVSGQSAEDITPPNLTITSPAEGAWVRQTAVFSGTVEDSESGLASVEVSVDGGYTWLPATVDGEDWELTWEAPEGQEFVSYPAWVRASDQAGNSTSEARVITVDNLAPTGLAPVTFSAPQGTHFDAPTPLTITWNAPVDGSGTATTLLAVDQVSDTTPIQEVTGTSATVPLAVSGDWYVHLAAKDAAGNQFTRHFGPWHVGTFGDSGTPFDQRQQSIVIDGYLDLEAGEWLTSTEFLDDDERPGERQSLYATWDGEAFYLGWQGAWWTLDGTLWAYLDTGPGGSNEAIGIAATLPFDADYAIEVASPTDGTLWHYNGDWQPAALDPSPGSGQGFAQGESGDTEVRLLLSTADVHDLQLIAFALDDDDQVWSIFPTTNPLSPPSGGAMSAPLVFTRQLAGVWPDAYQWDDLTTIDKPNADQPQATSVEMTLSSPQAGQAAWGPGNLLKYVVDLTNQEASEVAGLQLAFSTTTGLAYQTVDGAACADCTADDDWLLDVPPLPAGASHRVTVTGQLATDLSSLSAVTTSVTLTLDTATLGEAALSHRVDGQPPTVTVYRAGETLQPGLQTIYGEASDGAGVGVAGVQCREAIAGTWLDASGTLLWSFEVDVPIAPTFQLEVQAKDQHDQTSNVVLAEFTVDAVPPVVNWSLPAILSGDYAEIGGTTTDPYPVGGEVDQVELQLDQDTAPWRAAQVYAPDATGSQNWLWTWALPREDGVTHTLRVSATDAAGNASPASEWQETMVDTVAPVVTVTVVTTEVRGLDSGPVLTGTVSDGGGVSEVTVHVNTPAGGSYSDEADYSEGKWSYTPHFQAGGLHTMYVEAWDLAGNVTRRGPFTTWAPVPVGGVTIPVSTFDLLLPWITLVSAVVVGSVVVTMLRKRREGKRTADR